MKRLIKHIPNTLTSLNLLSGSLSIMFALNGEILLAGYLLLIAFHFDIFDGLSARLLKVTSEMGKELDSLADVVSFGLGPAAILFAMLKPEVEVTRESFMALDGQTFIRLIPFIIPVFAALRLARFNLESAGGNKFHGMPTPANALLVMSIPLIANHHPDSFLVHWFNNSSVIIAYSIIASVLMVCNIPLYSFKLKGFSWSVNKYTYLFLAGVAIILVVFGYSGLFLNVVYYLVAGIILAMLLKDKN